jgi:hypothetical protein
VPGTRPNSAVLARGVRVELRVGRARRSSEWRGRCRARSMRKLARVVYRTIVGSLATASIGTACGGSTDVRSTSQYAVCDGPGQCLALVPGCCGGCGAPTLDDVTGVNADKQDDFRAATCGDPHPVCPACPTMPEPNLVAFCEQGSCRAHDVRVEDVSSCSKDEDCMLRAASCCEPCSPSAFELIAVAKDRAADYRAKMCSPDQACSKCMPMYPAGWTASCATDGHCHVVEKTNVCPEAQPMDGAPCPLDSTVMCEYGEDIRPGCRTHATCTSGAWRVSVSGCPPLPVAGENGCPSSVGSDPCSNEGLACDMGGDTTCVCSACLGGPCSLNPRWACSGPPTTAGCGARPPRLGSVCDTEGLVCLYGSMCIPPVAAGRRCKDGAWVDEPLACPL